MSGRVQIEANRNGADELPVLENKLIDRCKRAEDQLARALEREQLLKQKLDEHAYADQSLHKQLDINLAALDQKVADMRDTLSQRDLSIARSQLIVAQLEKQNGALKQQLEIANQKLDDHAELERQHRLKMKEALEKVKNADKDKADLQAVLEHSAFEERQVLLGEAKQTQAALRAQLAQHAEEKQRLEEELQAVKDTAAFSDADMLQSELIKLRHEVEETVSAEALLRRDNSRLQQQLTKKDAEIKDLKRQVEEAGNLWKTTVAELSAAAEYKPRCEVLEKEVESLKAEVQAAGCRVVEMERNCSSMVDLLLTVKEHVTTAGVCAQDATQFLKGEMSTFFKDDGDSGPSTADGKVDSVYGEAMMATFEQLQGALQLMLESPTVGELLKSISNGPRQLVGIGETAKQLGKQLNEHQKAVHHRYFKIFEEISLIVRALDRASYELQGNRSLEFPPPGTGPTVSSSVPPPFAPTASAATHVSVVSKNDASIAQANAGAAEAAANTAAASAARADSDEAMQRTLQQVAESLSMLAAATSRTPSYVPSNPAPGPYHASEGMGRGDVKAWRGGVASPSMASPPILEWSLEGAPSPVLPNKSESVSGGGGRESRPGSSDRGRGEVGRDGVKAVFKALLDLEEDDVELKEPRVRATRLAGEGRMPQAGGMDEGKMVTVRKELIQTYREQMVELEKGLNMMQAEYMRKELHEKELGACQEMWAGKLDRYRVASELHLMGLQSQVDLLSSRGLVLEAENQTLKDRAIESEYKAKSLQERVQYLEESGRHDHESVAQINMEAHMRISSLIEELAAAHMRISSLIEELAAAQRELESRKDYWEVVEERENLKGVIAETATSVSGAVALRAEVMRDLATSNEELEAKIVSLENEIRVAHNKLQETEQECKEQVETAFEQLEKMLLRNAQLEADLENCAKCLQDSIEINDAMKDNVEAEKLKALAAEIHNIQQVQIPQEEIEEAQKQIEEAQKQILELKENVRLLEEQLEEGKKKHAKEEEDLTNQFKNERDKYSDLEKKYSDLIPKIQLLASQFKLEQEKSAKSKKQMVELVEELQEVQKFFMTAFAAVLQNSLMLITDNRKRDMLIKAEREERENERAKDRDRLIKEQEELKHKHEKLVLQSQEINDMAVQYKQILSQADDELKLSTPSKSSVFRDPTQTPPKETDADTERAAKTQSDDAFDGNVDRKIVKASTPPLMRAARAILPTGKPPLSPPVPSSAGDGGRSHRGSPAVKVIDALMDQAMQVASAPGERQDSSDEEDNEVEVGKQRMAAAAAAVLAAAGGQEASGGGKELQMHWLASTGSAAAGGGGDREKANAEAGDSALKMAREKLAAGDIAAANAASAAAAEFFDAAGEYGDERASELAELDMQILALAQGKVENAGLAVVKEMTEVEGSSGSKRGQFLYI